MFRDKTRRDREPRKWARAAGDRAVLSAAGNEATGRYIGDLSLEMTESIRFKPARPGDDRRLRSVRPSACSAREEQPRLSGEMDLTTGRAEVGYDEKKRDMVFSFVRHESDAEGREVQENRAQVRKIHGQDRFCSNDEAFAQGADTVTITIDAMGTACTLTGTLEAVPTDGSAYTYSLSDTGGMGESITGTLEIVADNTVSCTVDAFGPFSETTFNGSWTLEGGQITVTMSE